MANNGNIRVELSPSLKDRFISALAAIVALFLGCIGIVGALLVNLNNTMAQFIVIFLSALLILFSLFKILRIFTVKLVVDPETIRFRDQFIWHKVPWSEIISIGRANEIKTDDHKGVLKRIKALLLLTEKGIRRFEMSTYSLPNGINTVQKVMELRPDKQEIKEEEEEEASEVE
ncbi:MAG: hypothetical protein GF308_21160 [Candidatus Heimdallarchaeota archaeon]|nr:hypothetical protein [Candidatus Heimdallarchaeota archaeon]